MYMCVYKNTYCIYTRNGAFLAANTRLMYLELLASLLLLSDKLCGVKSLLYES